MEGRQQLAQLPIGSERGLEYDTTSALFAEFVDKEVLLSVISEVETQLELNLSFTKDPEGRGTIGYNSGGAATFSMAWWHPDLFRRVIRFSGTYVDQVAPGGPVPHGCWAYHDVDPHFTQMTDLAKGLIDQRCESATSGAGIGNPGPCDTQFNQAECVAISGCSWITDRNKPIRAWLESADGDLGHYDHAFGAGHIDSNVIRQTLPDALLWVWRGYPIE